MLYDISMLAWLFVLVNLLTLAGLLMRRYYRLFPAFTVAFGAATWQAVVALCLPYAPRGSSRAIWAPGEMLAMLAMGAALIEGVWVSVQQLPRTRRACTFGGLLVAAVFLTWDAAEPTPGDWYAQFIGVRQWLWLGAGIFAFCGFWFGLAANRIWPRVARMHMGLLAALACGHALFGGMLNWGDNRLHYRLLEMACCGGWLINSGFLAREIEEARKSDDVFLRFPHAADQYASPSGQTAAQGD